MSTRADYKTPSQKQIDHYSDLTTDLSSHPITQELNRLRNENAIKRSIRNILLTNKNERLFSSGFGGNLIRMLFEPISIMTSESIKQNIYDAITKYEPRAKLHTIEVIPDEDNNLYRVNIIFLIVNQKDPVGLTVFLKRVR